MDKWKSELKPVANAIKETLENSKPKSIAEFTAAMKKKGCEVDWDPSRKQTYITPSDNPGNNRFLLSSVEKHFGSGIGTEITRENLEKIFEKNKSQTVNKEADMAENQKLKPSQFLDYAETQYPEINWDMYLNLYLAQLSGNYFLADDGKTLLVQNPETKEMSETTIKEIVDKRIEQIKKFDDAGQDKRLYVLKDQIAESEAGLRILEPAEFTRNTKLFQDDQNIVNAGVTESHKLLSDHIQKKYPGLESPFYSGKFGELGFNSADDDMLWKIQTAMSQGNQRLAASRDGSELYFLDVSTGEKRKTDFLEILSETRKQNPKSQFLRNEVLDALEKNAREIEKHVETLNETEYKSSLNEIKKELEKAAEADPEGKEQAAKEKAWEIGVNASDMAEKMSSLVAAGASDEDFAKEVDGLINSDKRTMLPQSELLAENGFVWNVSAAGKSGTLSSGNEDVDFSASFDEEGITVSEGGEQGRKIKLEAGKDAQDIVESLAKEKFEAHLEKEGFVKYRENILLKTTETDAGLEVSEPATGAVVLPGVESRETVKQSLDAAAKENGMKAEEYIASKAIEGGTTAASKKYNISLSRYISAAHERYKSLEKTMQGHQQAVKVATSALRLASMVCPEVAIVSRTLGMFYTTKNVVSTAKKIRSAVAERREKKPKTRSKKEWGMILDSVPKAQDGRDAAADAVNAAWNAGVFESDLVDIIKDYAVSGKDKKETVQALAAAENAATRKIVPLNMFLAHNGWQWEIGDGGKSGSLKNDDKSVDLSARFEKKSRETEITINGYGGQELKGRLDAAADPMRTLESSLETAFREHVSEHDLFVYKNDLVLRKVETEQGTSIVEVSSGATIAEGLDAKKDIEKQLEKIAKKHPAAKQTEGDPIYALAAEKMLEAGAMPPASNSYNKGLREYAGRVHSLAERVSDAIHDKSAYKKALSAAMTTMRITSLIVPPLRTVSVVANAVYSVPNIVKIIKKFSEEEKRLKNENAKASLSDPDAQLKNDRKRSSKEWGNVWKEISAIRLAGDGNDDARIASKAAEMGIAASDIVQTMQILRLTGADEKNAVKQLADVAKAERREYAATSRLLGSNGWKWNMSEGGKAGTLSCEQDGVKFSASFERGRPSTARIEGPDGNEYHLKLSGNGDVQKTLEAAMEGAFRDYMEKENLIEYSDTMLLKAVKKDGKVDVVEPATGEVLEQNLPADTEINFQLDNIAKELKMASYENVAAAKLSQTPSADGKPAKGLNKILRNRASKIKERMRDFDSYMKDHPKFKKALRIAATTIEVAAVILPITKIVGNTVSHAMEQRAESQIPAETEETVESETEESVSEQETAPKPAAAKSAASQTDEKDEPAKDEPDKTVRELRKEQREEERGLKDEQRETHREMKARHRNENRERIQEAREARRELRAQQREEEAELKDGSYDGSPVAGKPTTLTGEEMADETLAKPTTVTGEEVPLAKAGETDPSRWSQENWRQYIAGKVGQTGPSGERYITQSEFEAMKESGEIATGPMGETFGTRGSDSLTGFQTFSPQGSRASYVIVPDEMAGGQSGESQASAIENDAGDELSEMKSEHASERSALRRQRTDDRKQMRSQHREEHRKLHEDQKAETDEMKEEHKQEMSELKEKIASKENAEKQAASEEKQRLKTERSEQKAAEKEARHAEREQRHVEKEAVKNETVPRETSAEENNAGNETPDGHTAADTQTRDEQKAEEPRISRMQQRRTEREQRRAEETMVEASPHVDIIHPSRIEFDNSLVKNGGHVYSKDEFSSMLEQQARQNLAAQNMPETDENIAAVMATEARMITSGKSSLSMSLNSEKGFFLDRKAEKELIRLSESGPRETPDAGGMFKVGNRTEGEFTSEMSSGKNISQTLEELRQDTIDIQEKASHIQQQIDSINGNKAVEMDGIAGHGRISRGGRSVLSALRDDSVSPEQASIAETGTQWNSREEEIMNYAGQDLVYSPIMRRYIEEVSNAERALYEAKQNGSLEDLHEAQRNLASAQGSTMKLYNDFVKEYEDLSPAGKLKFEYQERARILGALKYNADSMKAGWSEQNIKTPKELYNKSYSDLAEEIMQKIPESEKQKIMQELGIENNKELEDKFREWTDETVPESMRFKLGDKARGEFTDKMEKEDERPDIKGAAVQTLSAVAAFGAAESLRQKTMDKPDEKRKEQEDVSDIEIEAIASLNENNIEWESFEIPTMIAAEKTVDAPGPQKNTLQRPAERAAVTDETLSSKGYSWTETVGPDGGYAVALVTQTGACPYVYRGDTDEFGRPAVLSYTQTGEGNVQTTLTPLRTIGEDASIKDILKAMEEMESAAVKSVASTPQEKLPDYPPYETSKMLAGLSSAPPSDPGEPQRKAYPPISETSRGEFSLQIGELPNERREALLKTLSENNVSTDAFYERLVNEGRTLGDALDALDKGEPLESAPAEKEPERQDDPRVKRLKELEDAERKIQEERKRLETEMASQEKTAAPEQKEDPVAEQASASQSDSGEEPALKAAEPVVAKPPFEVPNAVVSEPRRAPASLNRDQQKYVIQFLGQLQNCPTYADMDRLINQYAQFGEYTFLADPKFQPSRGVHSESSYKIRLAEKMEALKKSFGFKDGVPLCKTVRLNKKTDYTVKDFVAEAEKCKTPEEYEKLYAKHNFTPVYTKQIAPRVTAVYRDEKSLPSLLVNTGSVEKRVDLHKQIAEAGYSENIGELPAPELLLSKGMAPLKEFIEKAKETLNMQSEEYLRHLDDESMSYAAEYDQGQEKISGHDAIIDEAQQEGSNYPESESSRYIDTSEQQFNDKYNQNMIKDSDSLQKMVDEYSSMAFNAKTPEEKNAAAKRAYELFADHAFEAMCPVPTLTFMDANGEAVVYKNAKFIGVEYPEYYRDSNGKKTMNPQDAQIAVVHWEKDHYNTYNPETGRVEDWVERKDLKIDMGAYKKMVENARKVANAPVLTEDVIAQYKADMEHRDNTLLPKTAENFWHNYQVSVRAARDEKDAMQIAKELLKEMTYPEMQKMRRIMKSYESVKGPDGSRLSYDAKLIEEFQRQRSSAASKNKAYELPWGKSPFDDLVLDAIKRNTEVFTHEGTKLADNLSTKIGDTVSLSFDVGTVRDMFDVNKNFSAVSLDISETARRLNNVDIFSYTGDVISSQKGIFPFKQFKQLACAAAVPLAVGAAKIAMEAVRLAAGAVSTGIDSVKLAAGVAVDAAESAFSKLPKSDLPGAGDDPEGKTSFAQKVKARFKDFADNNFASGKTPEQKFKITAFSKENNTVVLVSEDGKTKVTKPYDEFKEKLVEMEKKMQRQQKRGRKASASISM